MCILLPSFPLCFLTFFFYFTLSLVYFVEVNDLINSQIGLNLAQFRSLWHSDMPALFRDVWFGSKFNHICTKWDKSRNFSDQISVNFSQNELKYDRFGWFGANLICPTFQPNLPPVLLILSPSLLSAAFTTRSHVSFILIKKKIKTV